MSQNMMEANDNSPTTDKVDKQQTTGVEVVNDDSDEDIHVCRKCKIEFSSIQKYLEHKIKHDNYRVKYERSDVDRRMIMPKLVQKINRKALLEVKEDKTVPEEEKENDANKSKGKRGRKRKSDTHDLDLVITEKPVYSCEKCHKKFNREATLRRHIQYDHNEDDDDDDGGGNDDETFTEDDTDQDYKPTVVEIKEEELKERLYEEEVGAEMDSLDQVIMAAEMMEKAEASTSVAQTVSITTESGQVINAIITQVSGDNKQEEVLTRTPTKRQKLSDEEKALRKFTCQVCGNKFKDVNILKAHMVTHSSKREFICTFDSCPYSFKTKGSLKRHIRRHTGERPYPCELCGRNFAESGALTRHLKSRTPCTSKSDNDLPRYGKKWTYTPNIPAVNQSQKAAPVNGQESDSQNDLTQINEDTMIQEVSEVTLPVDDSGSKEQFSTMSTVVQVLEETLHEGQEEEFYDIGDEGGVEIVIGDTNDVITDDSINQFVQTEADIRDSVTNVCRVCGEDFVSTEALKIHLGTHLADRSSRCWLCHYNTEDKERFVNHLFTQHHVQIKNSDPLLDLMPLEPDIKDTVTDSKDKDTENSYKDAQIAVKQLMEIPDDNRNQQDLQASTRLLYKCPICNRRFRGSSYLKLHMRNHTGFKPHKCSECDKSFITKDTLNKHMTSHVEDRNFKCGECGKLFKRLSHVREHLKTHTGLRPFPCSVCGKTFKTNNAMKVHLRTHSDILPYECTYCHRRFREKGSVMRHMRMHTGEKPYVCTYCGRSFAEHGTLNRHLKAKVSCTKQLQDIRDRYQDDTDHTVLAEFSSVVADTQQYIIPEEGEEATHIQESLSQDDILKAGHDLQLDQSNQETEYVLVHAEGDEEQVQNLEIISGDHEQSMMEGVQVAGDFVVVTEADGSEMKIVDNATGQVIAVVPVGTTADDGMGIQTITLPPDGVISAVTMDTEIDIPMETVAMTELVESSHESLGANLIVEAQKEMQQSTENSPKTQE